MWMWVWMVVCLYVQPPRDPQEDKRKLQNGWMNWIELNWNHIVAANTVLFSKELISNHIMSWLNSWFTPLMCSWYQWRLSLKMGVGWARASEVGGVGSRQGAIGPYCPPLAHTCFKSWITVSPHYKMVFSSELLKESESKSNWKMCSNKWGTRANDVSAHVSACWVFLWQERKAVTVTRGSYSQPEYNIEM